MNFLGTELPTLSGCSNRTDSCIDTEPVHDDSTSSCHLTVNQNWLFVHLSVVTSFPAAVQNQPHFCLAFGFQISVTLEQSSHTVDLQLSIRVQSVDRVSGVSVLIHYSGKCPFLLPPFNIFTLLIMRQGSSVIIVTFYVMDDKGLISSTGRGVSFCLISRPALWRIKSPIPWIPTALSLGVKAAGTQSWLLTST